MKFKDYLILPALAMYVLYTSCAYVGEPLKKEKADSAPYAAVNPEKICWGSEGSGDGERWYATSTENGSGCFYVSTDGEKKDVTFISSSRKISDAAATVISGNHMKCFGSDGTNYDLIFPDELTAYDCNSGTYFVRADRNLLISRLISGEFVNASDPNDSFSFKGSGKLIHSVSNRTIRGMWEFETADTLRICKNGSGDMIRLNLQIDKYGELHGFTVNEMIYLLSAEA